MRITGDSPLVSYELIDLLVEQHIEAGADYTRISGPPLGARSEVITVHTLKKIKERAETDGLSEYMTLYFDRNPDFFRINQVNCPERFLMDDVRVSLDYPEDYETLTEIFNKLIVSDGAISLESVIDAISDIGIEQLPNRKIVPKYRTQSFQDEMLKRYDIKLSHPL